MITARRCLEIAEDAISGKRRSRLDRWLLNFEDMASMQKKSMLVYPMDKNGRPGPMTVDERRTLSELGYKIDENDGKNGYVVSWENAGDDRHAKRSNG
jgi:hypothetical protein